MPATPIIAPSILSADFARLGDDVRAVLDAGADWIHFDVMDNHFVPNLTFGPMVCKALRDYGVEAPIDVHLMVRPTGRLIDEFARAGATHITIHPEAEVHLDRAIGQIRESGCTAGLALNPATPLSQIEDLVHCIDLLLLMSVNPGFGGQKFIPYVLDKIKDAAKLVASAPNPVRIEVDGGVTLGNIAEIRAAGADAFVAGSAIFNSSDYASTIRQMRRLVQGSPPDSCGC